MMLGKKQKKQRYVALRNIEARKAEGWKVVEGKEDKYKRVLGVKTSALGEGKYEHGKEPKPAPDLVLMEK